jgi:tetratricopeptide (TPR) repeat protein
MLQARKHVALNDFQQAKSIIQPAIDAHPKEIWPRVVLSHALLKEGADSFAAEKALREILALDPNHKEARRNLETLLLNRRALAPQRQLGAPSMGAAPTSSGAPVNVPQLIRSMDKPRVSFCMIVRNGEGNLDACLKSVADLADEMIVVDTGSTDRTKEIAISAGAKVLDFAWQDSFAAARNESLRHANCRWIFWLDADETLDEENRSRLRRLFSGLGQENVGYLMRQFSPLEYAPEAAAYVDQVRLFPAHPEIRWQYRVHEQILLSIRRLGGEICATDIVINHSGFIDPSIQGAKVERNLRLLTIEHDENPNDYFVLFNLGAVAMTQGRLDEAIQFLQRSLTNTHPTDTLVPKIFSLLARCFLQQGKRDDALAWCRRGLAASPGDAELTFWEAVLLREQGAFADAERCLKQILNQPRQGHMASVDAGLYGFRTKHLLAEVYRLQGQNLQAESLWKEIVAEAPTFGPARLQLGELYLEQGRWDDLANVTASLSQAPQPNPEGMSLKARALLRRKEFAESRQILEKLIAIRPDALEPRLLLSYTFLQEGRDLPAAERSLRAILAIAPDHAETRHNLAVLMQHMKLQGS